MTLRQAPDDAFAKRVLMLVAAAVIAGCASKGGPAPVEDRAGAPRTPAPVASASAPAVAAPVAPAPATGPAEPAQRAGTYTVKPGDTLIRIGLDLGQSWRDIARWNNVTDPNRIEVGQVLQVVAPGSAAPAATNADSAAAVTRPVLPPGRSASAGPAATPAAQTPVPPSAAASAPAAAGASPSAATLAPGAAAANPDEDVGWIWPAQGPVASGFEEGKTKGLAITGKAGDAVLAAADGRVVYAGSGLRGYGNLVIVKHNNTYLTAYAHNQRLLVAEDQAVRRGQRIAEMGSTDAERVQLHFEIRRQGKPVDPAKLLPAR